MLKASADGSGAAVSKAANHAKSLLMCGIFLASFWRPVLILPGPSLGFGTDFLLGLGAGSAPKGAAGAAVGSQGLAVGSLAYCWLLNRAAGPFARLVVAGAGPLLNSKVGCAAAIAME